jgi:hypothetical protein
MMEVQIKIKIMIAIHTLHHQIKYLPLSLHSFHIGFVGLLL